MRKQQEEFAAFRDSQGTSSTYLATSAGMAYNGRKEHRECRPHLRPHAQPTMIGIIGMGFIPMYKVMGLCIFFTSLLLTVWGEFQLIITVCLRVAIIARYQECRVWMFAAL
jgi:hypothetical protein